MRENTSQEEPTVLVVDDREDMGTALQRVLRSAGWRTMFALGAESAIKLMKAHRFDVVISDFDMPKTNGLQLLQRIRILHPHVLRVLLTGRADVTIASRALNEGAAHRFFLKPFHSIDMVGALKLAVRSVPRPAPSSPKGETP